MATTRRVLALLLCLTATLGVARAQQPAEMIDSLSAIHNFGTIAEERGTVSHSFTLHNVSDQQMVILRVNTDCGCTTPSYDRTAVAPGDSIPILITYNPLNRPGSFVKYTRVYTSVNPSKPIKLTIKGNVATLGRPIPTNARYQQEIGALQVSNLFLDFPLQPAGEENTIRLMLNNPTGQPLEVSLDTLPSFLSSSISQATLAAYEPEEIFLTAHTDGSVAPGIHKGWIGITVRTQDGEPNLSGGVMVRLVMPPHFDKGAAAPLADLKTYQRLTDLAPEETLYEGVVTLKNDGKAPMHVYSAESNTAFLTILNYPETIAPGESSEIRYRLNLEGADRSRGALKANFDLLLNDPNAPLRNVLIVIPKR